MNDNEIVQLFWDRNQQAIAAASQKYGGYCASIAKNILKNQQDAEECVNDAYLNAWNAIPPHRPAVLSAFLGKLTRNLAFNTYRRQCAEKRGGGEIALVLEELSDFISADDSVEQAMNRKTLVKEINAFLDKLPRAKRDIFVCRNYYADSVAAIARRFGLTQNNVSVTLNRIRSQLKKHLTERGFTL